GEATAARARPAASAPDPRRRRTRLPDAAWRRGRPRRRRCDRARAQCCVRLHRREERRAREDPRGPPRGRARAGRRPRRARACGRRAGRTVRPRERSLPRVEPRPLCQVGTSEGSGRPGRAPGPAWREPCFYVPLAGGLTFVGFVELDSQDLTSAWCEFTNACAAAVLLMCFTARSYATEFWSSDVQLNRLMKFATAGACVGSDDAITL